MISPHTRRAPMSARQAWILLMVFAMRHLLGILIFVWLMSVARTAGGGFGWLLIGGLGAAYAAGVAYNGSRLYRQYRRRRAAERANG